MKEFFMEQLHDENRETFLFIAGKLAAFSGLWGGNGATNQKTAKDYIPMLAQQIYVETHVDGLGGYWLFFINADETVEATYLFKMGDDDKQYREIYAMSVDDLMKWARAQPPRPEEYAEFVPEQN